MKGSLCFLLALVIALTVLPVQYSPTHVFSASPESRLSDEPALVTLECRSLGDGAEVAPLQVRRFPLMAVGDSGERAAAMKACVMVAVLVFAPLARAHAPGLRIYPAELRCGAPTRRNAFRRSPAMPKASSVIGPTRQSGSFPIPPKPTSIRPGLRAGSAIRIEGVEEQRPFSFGTDIGGIFARRGWQRGTRTAGQCVQIANGFDDLSAARPVCAEAVRVAVGVHAGNLDY